MIPMAGRRTYSGRFVLRVGRELHERLAAEARALSLSLNEHCVRKLSGTAVGERLAGVGLDGAFVDRLVGAFPAQPLAVVLFGSVARGDFGTGSDTDLLVVFGPDVHITRSLYRCFDAVVDPAEFRHPPNPHLVALPRDATSCGGLWLEVAMDGIVVWERGTTVSSFLGALRERVATGALLRRTAYGHAYWVRREEEAG
jgi:hypothetical protein